MNTDTIQALTETFEGHAQQTENGVEYWLARDLQHLLGYSDWRNFEGVIKRAISIIQHKHLNGNIETTHATVKIGSGASRKITDYRIDREALTLLKELCGSYKLNNHFSIRNESVVMQLAEKYCTEKGLIFEYQFRLEKNIFDCMIDQKILIEFDEPHHVHNSRQKRIDVQKDLLARQQGFSLFRIGIHMDIIDLIIFVEKELNL